MITVTVETRGFGKSRFTDELYFENKEAYKRWRMYWQTHPNSDRLIYGWGRAIKTKSITRVIKVKEEN